MLGDQYRPEVEAGTIVNIHVATEARWHLVRRDNGSGLENGLADSPSAAMHRRHGFRLATADRRSHLRPSCHRSKPADLANLSSTYEESSCDCLRTPRESRPISQPWNISDRRDWVLFRRGLCRGRSAHIRLS